MTKFKVNDSLYYIGELNINRSKTKDTQMKVLEVLTYGPNATIENPKYRCNWNDSNGNLKEGWFKEDELEY